MASTLVIEDGSGVEGANSYATVAQARAYAASRGRTFPADDAAADACMLNAMDAIERYRDAFQGVKTTRDQALQWPREGVVVEGYAYDSDEIPPQLVQAQIVLAIESQTQPLVTNQQPNRLLSMKVEGAVDLKYADDGKTAQPFFALADSLLDVLLGDNASGTFGGFTTERV